MGDAARFHLQKLKTCGYGPPLFARATWSESARDNVEIDIALPQPTTVSANSIVTSRMAVETSGGRLRRPHPRGRKIHPRRRGAKRRRGDAVHSSHTSASLTIQENADPSVLADLTTALDRLAPENAGWTHDAEGPDDMPAHVKNHADRGPRCMCRC